MRLVRFRVTNFRSVEDSGWIDVSDQTALVGRNESGKSNLLLALRSLKISSGIGELSFAKDFPRGRSKSEFSEDLPVVKTEWSLTEEEQKKLRAIYPRAASVTHVEVGRTFKGNRWVGFSELPNWSSIKAELRPLLTKLRQSVRGQKGKANQVLSPYLAALEDLLNDTSLLLKPWGKAAKELWDNLARDAQSVQISANAHAVINDIKVMVEGLVADEVNSQKARDWVVREMPIFIYLDEYPELEGHQNIQSFIQRKHHDKLTEADIYFEKLMKVADLDPQELQHLLSEDHETRNQLANRAGAVVTRKIRELWKERPLKVRFNLDAHHFDTLISDPNAVYDVEVNLNERSRGFRWFFSFYITFAADTQGGEAENSVLLLDEPGLYLHALGQRDLLKHFSQDFSNQIIYTTHSPFMIPVGNLDSIRTVTISDEVGSKVSNDPVGDEKTLFPIFHALGVEISQTLFIGEWNLVLEGVTDYWYLSTVAGFLEDLGEETLAKEITLTPAGTSSKVPYMVTLLTSHRLRTLVLLDEEPKARAIATDLVKAKLARDQSIVYVSEGFVVPPQGGADIEDLLDPDVFDGLVRESYKAELTGTALVLDNRIPRIAKRYETAFKAVGIDFHKTRPARLFLRRMAESPESVLPSGAQQNFSRLFGVINARLQKLRRAEPFL